MGIEIGKRSLIAHTLGLSTVGHNLSNASTEGYSRQRVEMRAPDAVYMPALNREERAGQLGQGVEVARIERVRDMLLERRIIAEGGGEGYWGARDKYIGMLEQIYNEPSENSVRASLDRFWESWQELSVHPTEMAARNAVLQRGKSLIDAVHQRYYRLRATQDMLERDVQATVDQVNEITAEIGRLNGQIVKVKAMGDNPNDLLDRRDLLVNRLSGLVDVTISTQDPDEFVVHSGGMHIVQGRHFERLVAVPDPNNDSYSRVVWSELGQEATFRSGKLPGLIEVRDVDARQEIQKLDLMTVTFADLVNDIHRRGYGLNDRTGLDFFREQPAINNLSGNYDRSGDGVYDSTYVFRITGANSLDPRQQVGLAGTMTFSGPQGPVEVPYFATDTVGEIIRRINGSGAEVVARLDQAGQLSLHATPAADPANPEFVLRRVEDTGQFLVGYAGLLQQPGPAGAFGWQQPGAVLRLRDGATFAVAPQAHPAGWIEVNPALRSDPASIAAALSGPAAPSDGSAALAIAELRTRPVVLGVTGNFDEFFANVVAEIGLKGEAAGQALRTEEAVMLDLRNMREALSGVNIDEELTTMIKYQHGYAAAARVVTQMDLMLDTIINRMGV